MNEVDILKYHDYTLQQLNVVTFYTEEIENLFQEAYIGLFMSEKNVSRKQAEMEYCFLVSRFVVRRYYNDKCS